MMGWLVRVWRYVAGGGRRSSTGPAGPDHRPGAAYTGGVPEDRTVSAEWERLKLTGDVSYIGGPHRRGPGRPPQEPLEPLARCELPPAGWWCSLPAGHPGPCPTRQTGRVDWANITDLIRELKANEPPYVPRECQGADFTRVIGHLAQGLTEHAVRDRLSPVERAVFLDRGGHAPGEVCPSEPAPEPVHGQGCALLYDDKAGCTCLPLTRRYRTFDPTFLDGPLGPTPQALTLCASADRCALDPDCHAYAKHSTLDPGGKW